MALVSQGNLEVISLNSQRVINGEGKQVVVQYPHGRFVYEKQFVGDKVTRIPRVLTDWVKAKKPF